MNKINILLIWINEWINKYKEGKYHTLCVKAIKAMENFKVE